MPNLSVAACLRMAIGPTTARKTRAINIGAKSRDERHGRPVQSRGWLPLPTCQNKGFPRVLSPLTRRQSWLTSGYQRGFWSREYRSAKGLKLPVSGRFGSQNANRPPALGRRAARRPKGGRGVRLKAWFRSQFCGWSSDGGAGRVRCCDMNWSNSSLSLAWRSRSRNSRNSFCSSSSRRNVSMR